MTDIPRQSDEAFCWPMQDAHLDAGKGAICARPFGTETGDLDVDFTMTPRPVLITQLLRAGLRRRVAPPLLEDDILGWTLNRRLQGLLAIVVATRGWKAFLSIRCARSSCREEIELELELAALRRHDEANTLTVAPEHDVCVRARLPTGHDQMAWLRSPSGIGQDLPIFMATQIVERVNDSVPEEGWLVPETWLPCLESALKERDPFTVMELTATCPNCGHTESYDFDPEEYLLNVLAAVQRSVMDDIHRLATVYHWSEEEILSLSAGRRQYYLGRVLEGSSP